MCHQDTEGVCVSLSVCVCVCVSLPLLKYFWLSIFKPPPYSLSNCSVYVRMYVVHEHTLGSYIHILYNIYVYYVGKLCKCTHCIFMYVHTLCKFASVNA